MSKLLKLGNNPAEWIKWADLSLRELKLIKEESRDNWDRLVCYSKILQVGRELGNLGYSATNWASHTLFVEDIPIETLNPILDEMIRSFSVLLDMFYPLIKERAKIIEKEREEHEKEGNGSEFVI